MTTDIKYTAERIPLEVLNDSKFGLLDELLAPEFVDRSPQPGMPPTREGLKQSAMTLKTAFPDLHYVIEDAILSGDRIVHRLTATGTMKGDFMGMPATGKRATWTEIHIGKGVNGRLTEHWGLVDQQAILTQLGYAPTAARVPVTV
jgi:predicted ester cyclase